MKKVLILGGGVTGLRIAKYLLDSGYDVTIVEKSSTVGGMSKSFRYKDFILDCGPHKFYTQLPGVYDDYKEIIGEGEYLIVKKKNSLRLLGKYFDFPVKLSQLMININPVLSAQIMLDFIKAKFVKKKIVSYEDYFVKGFGEKGYGILFKGFAEKVWGNPKNISEELARKRSPASNIFDVIKSALKKDKNVSAESFYYPKKGCGVLCENLASAIVGKKGKILLNAVPQKINLEKGKVVSVSVEAKNKTKTIPCDVLVSTASIGEIPGLISPSLSQKTIDSMKKLKYRPLRICFVFIKKKKVLEHNWVFFPEKEFCFNRVAEQKSFSPLTCPEDKTVITAELTGSEDSEAYNSPDEDIKPLVLKDLEKAGIIKKEDVYDFFSLKAKQVYPVYEIGYREYLSAVLEQLDKIENLFSVGRLGLFNYNNIDHCLDMAKVVSEIITKNKGRSEWKKARDYFDGYRIVD
ncbi:MAG: FAD-dependent oxidoreductase [Nanoarchaeota archaeon]|nr:FAD-dependent oxidoreductase [Nanoarchaeota archaeon]MBU1052008.1 FAD-dependent oxidoreductase [Nanoarchaeota archaeon]